MIKESDLPVLNQLVKNLQDFYVQFKESYKKEDPDKFNKVKSELVRTQKEILGMVSSGQEV